MNHVLTGDKDTDILILLNLNNKDLFNFCSVNREAYSLCKNDHFWVRKIIKRYGREELEKKLPNQTYKEYYKEKLTKYIPWCKDLSKKFGTRLVADSLYNQTNGLIESDILMSKVEKCFIDVLLGKLTRSILNAEGEVDLTPIESRIRKSYNKLSFKWQNQLSNTYEFDQKDSEAFRKIIKDRMPLKSSRDFKNHLMMIGVDLSGKEMLLISAISWGFVNGKLDFTITWDDICMTKFMLHLKIKEDVWDRL